MKLSISLMKSPGVKFGDHSIMERLSHKQLALLLFLASKKGEDVSKEYLADMFWPDLGYENAMSNLRQALFSIRKQFFDDTDGIFENETLIISTRGSCRINDSLPIWVDYKEFLNCLSPDTEIKESERACRYKEAFNLYDGTFMLNIHVKKSIAFEEWIMYERESINLKMEKLALTLSDIYIREGKAEHSIECLNKMIRINPLSEEIHLALMKAYAYTHDRAKAISQYKKCTRILSEELNVGPQEATRAYYHSLIDKESDNSENFWMNETYPLRLDEEVKAMESRKIVFKSVSTRKIYFSDMFFAMDHIFDSEFEIPNYYKVGLARVFPRFALYFSPLSLDDDYVEICICDFIKWLIQTKEMNYEVVDNEKLDPGTQNIVSLLIDSKENE